MKRSLFHILAISAAGCLTLLSEKAYAQDGIPFDAFHEPSQRELNLSEDKSLIYDLEENRAANEVVQREATSPQPKIKEAAKEPKKADAKEKNKDAYSFNFLYYIIQKYKISDIVDQ